MNSFRELLEADAFEDMSEEFIRFHGKEWCDSHETRFSCFDTRRRYEFSGGELNVFVDTTSLAKVLDDIGFKMPLSRNCYFVVRTNGKKWASVVDSEGQHVGFHRPQTELISFLLKICGPEWVNHKDNKGLHMGFYCGKRHLIELALVGGDSFVNLANNTGDTILSRFDPNHISLLKRLGKWPWV